MLLNMGLGNDFFECDTKGGKKCNESRNKEDFQKDSIPSFSNYSPKFKKMIYSQIHSMRPPLP